MDNLKQADKARKVTEQEATRALEEDITQLAEALSFARCIMNDITSDYLNGEDMKPVILVGGHGEYSKKAFIVMDYLTQAYATVKRLYELDGSELR